MAPAVIDPHTFDELQANAGADFVADLVDTFADDAPRLLAAMRAAQASADGDGWRRAAHALKSNASTFGAVRLAGLARDCELGGIAAGAAALAAAAHEFELARDALRALARP